MEVRGSGGASRQGAGGRGGGLEATRHRVSQLSGSVSPVHLHAWNMRLSVWVSPPGAFGFAYRWLPRDHAPCLHPVSCAPHLNVPSVCFTPGR